MPDKSPLGWRWQKIHLSRSSLIQALTFASLGCVCFCETKWLHQMGVSQNFVPPIQPSTFSPWNSNFGFTPWDATKSKPSLFDRPAHQIPWMIFDIVYETSVCHSPDFSNWSKHVSDSSKSQRTISQIRSSLCMFTAKVWACFEVRSQHIRAPWHAMSDFSARMNKSSNSFPSKPPATHFSSTNNDFCGRNPPAPPPFFAEIVVLSLDCTETSKNQWLGSLGPSVSRCLKWSTEDTED